MKIQPFVATVASELIFIAWASVWQARKFVAGRLRSGSTS
jgi:hypothetical protein